MIILFIVVAIIVFIIIFGINEVPRRRRHQAMLEAKKKKFRDSDKR